MLLKIHSVVSGLQILNQRRHVSLDQNKRRNEADVSAR